MNWENVTSLIDSGLIGSENSFEFTVSNFGDFPSGNNFFSRGLVINLAECVFTNECSPDRGCDSCSARVLYTRYRVRFCYNSQCYLINIDIPQFYNQSDDRFYYLSSSGSETLICDSYNNNIDKTENDWKCCCSASI